MAMTALEVSILNHGTGNFLALKEEITFLTSYRFCNLLQKITFLGDFHA